MKTEILSVDPLHPSVHIIKKAADLILRGTLVAFPTETVYGLGADATNDDAVKKIYEVKGRPADNPLIAHFASTDHIFEYISEIPSDLERLARIFWPGPLTIVLNSNKRISSKVTQGLESIAVRIPAHRVAISFIEECGIPIAAPSANRSGRPSPTQASHVLHDLEGLIPLIIDGGTTLIGVESTVISLTTDQPVLLRPGGVTVEDLKLELPNISVPDFMVIDKPLSPGMKYIHYSPVTQLALVMDGFNFTAQYIDNLAKSYGTKPYILCTNSEHKHNVAHLLLGVNLKDVQVNLFASLRLLDLGDYDFGVFEGVSSIKEGFTIMNRVKKASHLIIS